MSMADLAAPKNQITDKAGAGPVRFTLRKHRAYVDHLYLDLVRPVLERDVRHFGGDGCGRVRVSSDKVSNYRLHTRTRRRRVSFPAGLVNRVTRYLEAVGYQVEVDDRSWWPQLLSVNEAVLGSPSLNMFERELLAEISNTPRGQIITQKTSEIPKLIGLLGRLFVKQNIQVITKNNKDASALLHGVQAYSTRKVLPHNTSALSRNRRLCVGTWDDLADCNWEYWDVTVFSDVQSAVAAGSIRTIAGPDSWLLRHSLLYAFVGPNQRMDEETRLRLESVVGPVIIRSGNDPTDFTDVHVIGIGPSSYPSTTDLTPLERKRENIWHNLQRNQHIAEVARAFAANDHQALRTLGIWWGEVEDLLDRANTVPSVAVLVEVLQHGRALRRLLPHWRLLGAADGSTKITNQDLPALADEKTNRAIVTLVRAHRARVAADVVIRADGTGSTWGDDYLPNSCFNGGMMIVVDVRDDFDEQATRDTQYRWREYAERGWETGPMAIGPGPTSPYPHPTRSGPGAHAPLAGLEEPRRAQG